MPIKYVELIPVVPEIKTISSPNLRRSSWRNFIQRGPVTYNTLVIDKFLRDVLIVINYFNPEFYTEQEINDRFGIYPNSDGKHDWVKKFGYKSKAPRILLFPENKTIVNQTPVRTQPH